VWSTSYMALKAPTPLIPPTGSICCIHDDSSRPTTTTALFAGDSQSSARLSAGGFGVLTAHADAPVVPEAAVGADLLVPFQVLAELGSQIVGKRLHGLARLPLALPVQEPLRDLELLRALDNSHQLFNFILGQLASARRDRA